MNGYDRRTAAACPRFASEDSLYTPVRVVELDLDEPSELRSPGGLRPVDPDGRVLALVRLHGHPLGLVTATGTAGDTAALSRALVDAAHRRLSVPSRATATPAARLSRVSRARVSAGQPLVSVILCTRDRTEMLPGCLDSLMRIDYPNLELIVVDNAPSSDATEVLIRSRYADRVRYVQEPAPGLSWARNRGLAAARGTICAFTDDDTVADAGWVRGLVEAFDFDHRVGCVTGMLLPAELDTKAQLTMEAFAPAMRGFAVRMWSLREPEEDPLVRFSAGRFGCGANMAFRTDVLRAIGGFDTATGTGTPARGGEDLLAFQQVLTAGHTLIYQPEAIVWHRHRRTMAALARQVQGFGIGFSAYLTAAVSHQPSLLVALVRRLPRGVWQWHRANRTKAELICVGHRANVRALKRLERRGLLYGPFCYLLSVWQQRRVRSGG